MEDCGCFVEECECNVENCGCYVEECGCNVGECVCYVEECGFNVDILWPLHISIFHNFTRSSLLLGHSS